MNYPALRLDILQLFAEAQTKGEARYRWDERAGMTIRGRDHAERRPPDDWKEPPVPLARDFGCSCGARFATKPALGAHRWTAHGLRAVPAQAAPRPARKRGPKPGGPKVSPQMARILERARAQDGAIRVERYELESAQALARAGLGVLAGRDFRLA